MGKYGLIALSALALVACEENLYDTASSPADSFAERTAPQVQSKRGRDSSSDIEASTDVYLAYRYGYDLVMPSKSVKATTAKHIQICRDAGPRLCQITGSNTNSYSDNDVRANLGLRANPEWLTGFTDGMKADVAAVKGRIQKETTSVEDLTRAILDTDARLKAKRALRVRLEKLLETRDAKLPDLLALENELARVQGEIESATATLKALRARISMSVVNISYSSDRRAVSAFSFAPVTSAMREFTSTLSYGLAGVIHFVAFLLPWTIFVIIPGFFLGRWFWRRRKIAMPTLEDITDSTTTD